MSKYFLGSVGSAEAFRNTKAGRQLAFVCKTLTDSSINISTTKDDLRGGTGAPIVTNFYHDPNVEITLTDIFWKESYLEAQLGAMFAAAYEDSEGKQTYIKSYQSETHTVGEQETGKITLEKDPQALPVACDSEDTTIIWYAKAGSEDWKTLTVDSKTVTIPNSTDDEVYCVRYLAFDEQAREAIVTSNIIPAELYLVITTPIFFGDACSTSNGKLAGSLTFEIPRFKLNGAQNFSFNMSSNTTMELSGTALADFTGCDMINGQLVRIIETIDGRNLASGIVDLMVDKSNGYTVGTNAALYGIYENGSVAIMTGANSDNTTIDSDGVDCVSVIANGVIHIGNAANYTVTYSNITTKFTAKAST